MDFNRELFRYKCLKTRFARLAVSILKKANANERLIHVSCTMKENDVCNNKIPLTIIGKKNFASFILTRARKPPTVTSREIYIAVYGDKMIPVIGYPGVMNSLTNTIVYVKNAIWKTIGVITRTGITTIFCLDINANCSVDRLTSLKLLDKTEEGSFNPKWNDDSDVRAINEYYLTILKYATDSINGKKSSPFFEHDPNLPYKFIWDFWSKMTESAIICISGSYDKISKQGAIIGLTKKELLEGKYPRRMKFVCMLEYKFPDYLRYNEDFVFYIDSPAYSTSMNTTFEITSKSSLEMASWDWKEDCCRTLKRTCKQQKVYSDYTLERELQNGTQTMQGIDYNDQWIRYEKDKPPKSGFSRKRKNARRNQLLGPKKKAINDLVKTYYNSTINTQAHEIPMEEIGREILFLQGKDPKEFLRSKSVPLHKLEDITGQVGKNTKNSKDGINQKDELELEEILEKVRIEYSLEQNCQIRLQEVEELIKYIPNPRLLEEHAKDIPRNAIALNKMSQDQFGKVINRIDLIGKLAHEQLMEDQDKGTEDDDD